MVAPSGRQLNTEIEVLSRITFKNIGRQKRLRHTGQINVKLPALDRHYTLNDLKVGEPQLTRARLIDTQTGGAFQEDRRRPHRQVE